MWSVGFDIFVWMKRAVSRSGYCIALDVRVRGREGVVAVEFAEAKRRCRLAEQQ